MGPFGIHLDDVCEDRAALCGEYLSGGLVVGDISPRGERGGLGQQLANALGIVTLFGKRLRAELFDLAFMAAR